jgi:hypothetical protein
MKYVPSVLPSGVLMPNGANISTNIRVANRIINATQQLVKRDIVRTTPITSTIIEIVDNTTFETLKALNVNGTSLVTPRVSGGIYCSNVDAKTSVTTRTTAEHLTADAISTEVLYREEQTVVRGTGTLQLSKGVWFITYSIVVPPCAWVHAYGMGKEKVGEVLIPGSHEGVVGSSFLYVADDETVSFWAETPERVAGSECTALRII